MEGIVIFPLRSLANPWPSSRYSGVAAISGQKMNRFLTTIAIGGGAFHGLCLLPGFETTAITMPWYRGLAIGEGLHEPAPLGIPLHVLIFALALFRFQHRGRLKTAFRTDLQNAISNPFNYRKF